MVESVVKPDLLGTELRAGLGEEPVWHDGKLHFVDILGCRLHSARLDVELATMELPQHPGFAVPHANDGWLVGFQDGLWRRSGEDADRRQTPRPGRWIAAGPANWTVR